MSNIHLILFLCKDHVPVLLLEKGKCCIIVGKWIVSQLEEEKLDEGVLALLASFYLLDFDYPGHHEIGLICSCNNLCLRT